MENDEKMTMLTLIGKSNEYNLKLQIIFVDYEKGFDSMEPWAVFKSLRYIRQAIDTLI